MKLDTLVLIAICVMAGMMVTVWLTAMLLAAFHLPFVLVGLLPAALVGYVIFRLIRDRVGDSTEDHYDGMKH